MTAPRVGRQVGAHPGPHLVVHPEGGRQQCGGPAVQIPAVERWNSDDYS
ncbi:hypothetical protein AB0E96_10025 [Kitasatospora sp. NPDC036755]